jgi:hypothetical protein
MGRIFSHSDHKDWFSTEGNKGNEGRGFLKTLRLCGFARDNS